MSDESLIKVPDIGATAGDVIEILVKPGDTIERETALITLESEKASMEIPSPIAGVVKSIKVKLGDKLKEGDDILTVTTEDKSVSEQDKNQEKSGNEKAKVEEPEEKKQEVVAATPTPQKMEPIAFSSSSIVSPDANAKGLIIASPGVRRIAREFGVDLSLLQGSGRKQRIMKEDIQQFVKKKLQEPSTPFISPAVAIDFSQYGTIERQALNKIKRLTAANLHRSWITIPHVTQFDEADISDLETFRKAEAPKAAAVKLTLLAFIVKVICTALKTYPQFNASLDANGEYLIYKYYYNIGIAVETEQGLMVPVIKNADAYSLLDIAGIMKDLSDKARTKMLKPSDLSGASFTISSLGGIGGTGFTPIINPPEVAILGVSRMQMKPVYHHELDQFVPRLLLPLSLSYDHRVIDGAEAARFTKLVAELLADIRKVLL